MALGSNALTLNTTGNYNLAIGTGALASLTAGGDNVGLGFGALTVNTSSNNLGIGSSSLGNNSTGSDNVGVGTNSLSTNITGSRNVGIGRNSLSMNGDDNVGIGAYSLSNVLSVRNQNTAIGSDAGRYRTGGSNLQGATGGIYIGYGAKGSANAQTNEIVIGTLAEALGSNTAVIGASTQTAATIYGVLSLPGGLSAAGATFSGNISAPNIVNKINGLTGGVTFAAGTNITLTPVGNTITIASSGGGGGGSSVYGVTASLDFSENINGLEIVFYGLGGDYSTSLKYIENDTITYINLSTNSIGDYYGTFKSIKSFYDANNGWSAKLLLKPPFTDISNPLITTTAESIYADGFSSIYFTPASTLNADYWTSFASTTLYHQEETYVTKTLTGITWVSESMFLSCKVLGLTSSDHTAEDAILEGVNFEINNIVGGTGFDIIGHAPEGTYGKYTIKCLGQ